MDAKSQTYYELEVGNPKSLDSLIQKEEGYIPSIWTISIIPKSGNDKIDVYLTPSGKIYGFNRKVADNVAGASLNESEAKDIAEKESVKSWNFNINEYSLADKSNKVQRNGRIDYTFDYKRNVKIGQAKDKVELKVIGDKLTKLQHNLEIPEIFSRQYDEKRSANDTIAMASMICFYVLIFIVGLFCFFYLSKRKLILWKKPLIFSIFIAVIIVLSGLTNIKDALTAIDTSMFTPNIFYVIVVFGLLLVAVLTALFTFLSSLIGEGLSRKAFPKHLKFWDMFTIKNMGSRQFLNRVIIAYVFVVLMMMYETIFYGTVGHLPGWWNPASMVTDPNIQTNWFAWLQHFGNALNAGFFEEFAFRAIPISLGVLIGSRFNKRRLGITIAFIFEVLMFSAAHANYPGFPAYARLLELLVVAFSFGVVFYYFGIIPGIIAHFIYDFLNMAMPIMTTPGNILAYQKVLVVIILLSPLILALYGRTRNKAWLDVTQSTYNEADQGINLNNADNSFNIVSDKESVVTKPIIAEETQESMVTKQTTVEEAKKSNFFKNDKKTSIVILICMLFISVAIVIGLFTLKTAVPQLKTEKNQAEVLATQELEKRGFKLTGQWKTISDVSSKIMMGTSLTEVVITPSDIIKREGSDKYKSLIGNYIIPLKWHVRFIKIDGDVNSRAEEYNVTLTDKGQEINLEHRIPDNRKGVNLTKEDAKSVLYKVIKEKYALTESDLKEISADEKKLDGRTDWSFVLEDKTVHLKEYIPQIKATISGDEVLSLNKTLDLPESKRNDMFKKMMILTMIMFVALIPFIGSILVAAVRSVIAWTKKQISKTIFIRLFIFLLILNGLSLFLDAPSSMINYSTAMPFKISLITTYALGILGKLLISFFQASIIAYAKSFYGQATQRKYFGIALSVIAAMFIFTLGLVFASRPSLISDTSIYCSLGYYNKLLSELVHVCSSYIGSLAIIFALTAILNNTKKKFWKVFLTISILLPLGEYVSIGVSSPVMIIIFLSTGIVYIVLYLYLFKQDCSLIPLFIGTLALLDIIKGLVLNQYPGLSLSIIVSINTL